MPKRKNSNLYEVTAQVDGKRRHFYGRTKAEALAKKKAYVEAMEKSNGKNSIAAIVSLIDDAAKKN